MPLHALRLALTAAAALLWLVGCGPVAVDDSPVDDSPVGAAASPSPDASAAPATPASDSHVDDQVSKARAMLAGLEVAGRAPKTGYDRTGSYGQTWADVTRSGCGTRDNVLARDLTDIGRRNPCVVVSGTLDDPYTGTTIEFVKADASKVQIDHLVPLALSWQLGAQQWPAGKRVTFANDPLNLLAVDGRANAQKSASGPDAWLPPNTAYRCTYVIGFTRVADAYEMRVTASMRDAISDILDRCRRVVGSPADGEPLPRETWAYAAKFARPPATPTTPPSEGPATSGPGTGTAPRGDSCPTGAPIKGNIPTDGGDRIYHPPGSRSYGVTIPELCFATAQEAEAAGFRAPR